ALPPVDAEKAAALVRSDGRRVPPGVTLRPLHLDDIRPHFREQHRAVRPGNVLSKISDRDSRQRPAHARIVCERESPSNASPWFVPPAPPLEGVARSAYRGINKRTDGSWVGAGAALGDPYAALAFAERAPL